MKDDCVFCKIINGEIPTNKIYEDDEVISFLSIDPVTYGHTLIIPKKHFTDYTDIDLETLNYINKIGKKIYKMLWENLKCDGMKLVQNNVTPQEVKHYHLHLIPIFDNEPSGKDDFEKVLKEIKNGN